MIFSLENLFIQYKKVSKKTKGVLEEVAKFQLELYFGLF